MSSVTPVGAAGAATASTDTATTSMDGPGTVLDRDAFLKLLVAQLKYQDPTNPADASQMVAQTSQLTMVDRLNEIATQMTASAGSQRIALASSFVGREVTFPDADGASHTALVTAARFDGDEVVLTAGTWSVPMGAVTAINAGTAGRTATSTPTGTTGTTGTSAAGAA